MTLNMGKTDRIIRLAIAAALLWMAFATTIAAAGVLHWLAVMVAAVFILTSTLGNCPIYSIIGLKTCRDC